MRFARLDARLSTFYARLAASSGADIDLEKVIREDREL